MRQIVLDTETTGLDPKQGHRIIEIGGVELLNRKLTGKHFHVYINPEREVDKGALEVHGLTDEFLSDKPVFSSIADSFIEFAKGAELVIHNAPFDIGFLDAELSDLNQGYQDMSAYCSVLDTLVMARKKHPGQKNNLDALCKRYFVDNTQRELHGALLDAEILADVYLMMTGGQTSLLGGDESQETGSAETKITRLPDNRERLKVIKAGQEEILAHDKRLKEIENISEQGCLWLN
jgi:DNA polymerase III subunit epsilon